MYISDISETVSVQGPWKQSSLKKEDFLKLLTYQLKNQDFFNPQDNSQFMNQVMEMTMVEQLCNLNEKLNCFFEAEQQFQTITMLGKAVEVINDDGTTTCGLVKGVKFTAAGPVLDVNGSDYYLSQVAEIQIGDEVFND